MNSKEWSDINKWNPFNSMKLLAHVERWKHINDYFQIAPHPVLVTVDPINSCNLNCIWCNSGLILKKRKRSIRKENLEKLAEFLSSWTKLFPESGVRAVCLAGGGEPLLHPFVGFFIDKLRDFGIEVGIVTNGTLIHRFLSSLTKCTWVGVSLDCGSGPTFIRLKGKDQFFQILSNIEKLANKSKISAYPLGRNIPGYGITLKYLLHPYNYLEVYTAIKLAKEIGCKQFHLRPYGTPWNEIGKSGINKHVPFNYYMIQSYNEQMERARSDFEDKSFRIYGITHKMDSSFSVGNNFNKCWAMFMNGVFMPGKDGTITFGLCCDRRGDSKLELVKDTNHMKKISDAWSSLKHWDIFRNLDVSTCPRCTFQPHNQIYENVILKDCMTWKFI